MNMAFDDRLSTLIPNFVNVVPEVNPTLPTVLENAKASTASEVCKRLETIVNNFMATLDPREEVGVALSSFGAAHLIAVTGFRAMGPNLLVITGTEGEQPVTLVQHVSQLSFLLVPIKLASSETEPRRTIEFQSK